jgi:hypothetical protein
MGGFGLVTAIKPRIFRRFAFLPPGRSKLAARGIPLSVPIGTPVAGQPAAALGWFGHSFASGWHSSGSEVSRPSRRAGGFARSRSSKRSGWSGCLPGRITTLLRISDVSDGCFPPGLSYHPETPIITRERDVGVATLILSEALDVIALGTRSLQASS